MRKGAKNVDLMDQPIKIEAESPPNMLSN